MSSRVEPEPDFPVSTIMTRRLFQKQLEIQISVPLVRLQASREATMKLEFSMKPADLEEEVSAVQSTMKPSQEADKAEVM